MRLMWDAHTQRIPDGLRIRVSAGGARLTFRELFRCMAADPNFTDWYAQTLSRLAYQAFFWEHPPLTEQSVEEVAEFVLIESASLAGLSPDPRPFKDKFDLAAGADVITFDNLGGDARLVVPTPVGALGAYPHLAAFMRGAPNVQIRSLFETAARAVFETLGTHPRWLSTAGLGVSWLHLRLDTRPKYYRYLPYKTAD